MTDAARTRDGRAVHVGDFRPDEWEALKRASTLGDFRMACCQTPAVLKTSINGVRFFSHLSDECATAPETVWHQAGKEAVLGALRSLGLEGRDEVPGQAPDGRKWTADVLFTTEGRTVAIELQRSPQTLREFLRRQERYQASGVEIGCCGTRTT
jgi:competence CoiA-like predicted nuclease